MTDTELIAFIHRYFASEKHTALINVSLGVAMIIAAVALRRWSVDISFQKGVAYPLISVGLFLMLAAGAFFFVINWRATSLISSYKKLPEVEARSQETARLSRIVTHSYKSMFWICGAMITVGIPMGFMSSQSLFRRGVAFGLVLVSLLIIMSELYSKQKNIQFLREIQASNGYQ